MRFFFDVFEKHFIRSHSGVGERCITTSLMAVNVASCSSSSNSSGNLSDSSYKPVLIESQATKRGGSLRECPSTKDEVDPESKEYFCGIGRFRPKRMQVFRNAIFFTFILCLYSCIEGAIVSGFTSVILSSIERRYRFSSIIAGLVASVFDMSVLFSVLFISYFGGRGHKPRWLGISLIIQGIGSLVFSLPQFVFGSYKTSDRSEEFEFCDMDSHYDSDCSSSNNLPLVFFFLGNILIGIGAAPLFTVGTTYLDDIVHPKYVSIHLGIFYVFSVIGPSIGYGLGGAFLSIYVDPWKETTLEPSDPEWVGAWWLCFVVAAVISWLISIPFLMFPKFLPNSAEVRMARQREMAQVYEGKDNTIGEVDLATKFKTFPKHLKLVLKTPSWIFITAAICFSTLIVSGMVSFAPKYLETQFGLIASTASIITGAIAIPCGGAGVFMGALIIFITKSSGRGAALINWIITLVSLAPTLIFLIHCPSLELVGVTVPYPNGSVVESAEARISGTCFAACGCNSSIYEPVCGEDNFTYFSPCTAGCQRMVVDNTTMETVFEECSCVAERLQDGIGNFSMTAKDGICDQGCNQLWIFVVILGLIIFVLFVLQIPNVIITVRSVADEQRTLALGLQSVLFRSFGSIPGPIIFGAIFDSACVYWQYECSRRGNCWTYNNSNLSQRALSLALLGIGANFILSFLSWIFYPKKTASEEEVKIIDLTTIDPCEQISPHPSLGDSSNSI